MQIHITNLNNLGGTATIAQRNVTKIARNMGWKELSIFYYRLGPDFQDELCHRLDGTFASFGNGDIMFFQYPSWMGIDYDEWFIDRVKSYSESKLVIFVEDIQQLMFNSEEWILHYEISSLNKADLLILPSKKMHCFLITKGLCKNIPVVYQTIWDMPGNPYYSEHRCEKKIFFPGDMSRFTFIKEYHGKTPIEVFQAAKPDREDDDSFLYGGYMNQEELCGRLAEGGFGLVWAEDDHFERYYHMNQPHKIGYMLSCGIPVIVRKNSVHEEFVKKHGIGFSASSLEEVDGFIQNMSDEEMTHLYRNVQNVQKLLLEGTYTYQVLQEALMKVMTYECIERRYDDFGVCNGAGAIANLWLEELKRRKSEWDNKDILIVEKVGDRTGIDNDLYDNTKSITRVVCKCDVIEDCRENIISEIKQYGINKLVLVYLGSDGYYIAQHLGECGVNAISMGDAISIPVEMKDALVSKYLKQIVSKIEYKKR